MGWLPSRRISVGITATRHVAATETGTNYSEQLFQAIPST